MTPVIFPFVASTCRKLLPFDTELSLVGRTKSPGARESCPEGDQMACSFMNLSNSLKIDN